MRYCIHRDRRLRLDSNLTAYSVLTYLFQGFLGIRDRFFFQNGEAILAILTA